MENKNEEQLDGLFDETSYTQSLASSPKNLSELDKADIDYLEFDETNYTKRQSKSRIIGHVSEQD
jgi:hypothetical protein